jgi:hypothetical protein
MYHSFGLIILLSVTICLPAYAVDIVSLSDCSIRVYQELRATQTWSGKAPKGCADSVYVEKYLNGIKVTAWTAGQSGENWVRVSFSTVMVYPEMGAKKAFKKARQDITSRATRIERCLNSIISVNDPLECRDKAMKSYLAGEEIGIEYDRQIWLDDDGRYAVVDYSYGNTSKTVSPPADLFSGQALPPGTKLNIFIRGNQ